MKNIKQVFLFALAFVIVGSASAQSRVGGRVVEIVDGKTVVIEMLNGSRLTAELQYIEVPEAGQPLHQTVKEHLHALVFNKAVEFRARGLTQTKTVGQLLLNGVDVSQQMIRDGAAWYAALQKSGQDAAESEVYQSNEAQAKSEKSGVWSIESLKPPWLVRAEAQEARLRAEKTLQEAVAQTTVESRVKLAKSKLRSQMSNESLMWTSTPETNARMPENVSNVGGLMVGYNPKVKVGIIATPFLRLAVPDKETIRAIGIGVGYFYHDDEIRGRESVYLIGIESDSSSSRFLKFNDLTVTADNQKIIVGKARRGARQYDSVVKELLIYEVKRSVITKIANAKSLSIKVGTYSANLNFDVQMMLKNLLNASE